MAGKHPEVMRSSRFRQQLKELAMVGWLSEEQAGTLAETALALHEIRLLHVLVPAESVAAVDASASRLICERLLANPDPEAAS
jgi:hypothetical protein